MSQLLARSQICSEYVDLVKPKQISLDVYACFPLALGDGDISGYCDYTPHIAGNRICGEFSKSTLSTVDFLLETCYLLW